MGKKKQGGTSGTAHPAAPWGPRCALGTLQQPGPQGHGGAGAGLPARGTAQHRGAGTARGLGGHQGRRKARGGCGCVPGGSARAASGARPGEAGSSAPRTQVQTQRTDTRTREGYGGVHSAQPFGQGPRGGRAHIQTGGSPAPLRGLGGAGGRILARVHTSELGGLMLMGAWMEMLPAGKGGERTTGGESGLGEPPGAMPPPCNAPPTPPVPGRPCPTSVSGGRKCHTNVTYQVKTNTMR